MIIERDSNVNITDCRFLNNFAKDSGGGIYIGDNSNVNIIRCRFEGNNAAFGGAIAMVVGRGVNEQNTVNMNIEDSWFENNIARSSGGAFYAKLLSSRLEDAEKFYNNIQLYSYLYFNYHSL